MFSTVFVLTLFAHNDSPLAASLLLAGTARTLVVFLALDISRFLQGALCVVVLDLFHLRLVFPLAAFNWDLLFTNKTATILSFAAAEFCIGTVELACDTLNNRRISWGLCWNIRRLLCGSICWLACRRICWNNCWLCSIHWRCRFCLHWSCRGLVRWLRDWGIRRSNRRYSSDLCNRSVSWSLRQGTSVAKIHNVSIAWSIQVIRCRDIEKALSRIPKQLGSTHARWNFAGVTIRIHRDDRTRSSCCVERIKPWATRARCL